MDDRFTALKRILTGALDRPAAERDAWVRAQCGGDDDLRAEAEAKLARLGEDASVLLTGGLEAFVHTETPPGALPSDGAPTVARYSLQERIGEGGFGEVYRAEQIEPVQRRVALKVLKAGLDTRAVLARFEAERQALAVMDHPCIAKVFDAGRTDQGRPYFAMEYVDGSPITDHCDRERLGTRDRLRLILRACEGVQHAHQKAVIHRDLKPSNVLVGGADGVADVKVIDFGVAKAMESPLTERTLQTEVGQIIGTPEYMSPEQAEMSGDIDTRTDVYALGAMLYELLTGHRPFDTESLRERGVEGIRKVLRETDPPRPSTRISTADRQAVTPIAANRRTTPNALAGSLRGDLDWITMKALEKDRARRYGSPAELAADIERHLRHEPVIARPPSVPYLAARFVRRHRIGTAVTAAAVVALVAFAAREKIQSERIAREQARSERVAAFLTDMLGEIEPQVLGEALWSDLRRRVETAQEGRAPGEAAAALAEFDRLTAGVNPTDAAMELLDREILERAAHTVEERLGDDPLVAARLRSTLGRTYRKLGLYERGEPHLREALALREGNLAPDHPDVLTSRSDLGALLVDRVELETAEALARSVLEDRKRVLGPGHVDTYLAHHELAHVVGEAGNPEEAEENYRIALEGLRRLAGDDDPRTLEVINALGFVLLERRKESEAEELWRESLERRRRVLGDDAPPTLESLSNLGFLLQATGRLDEAEPYYREALDGMRRVLGDGHPWTLTLNSNLGYLFRQQGRLDEAEPYYRLALEGRRRVLGEDNDETIMAINNMAFLLKARGEIEEAESTLREALAGFRRVLGEEHPTTLSTVANLAFFLEHDPERSARLYREAMDGFLRTVGEDDPETHRAMGNLASQLGRLGRLDEAEELFRQVIAARARARGDDHRLTNANRCSLAQIRMRQGADEEALELLQAAARHGYDVGEAIEEPVFARLRGRPEFDALFEESGGPITE